MADLFSLEQTAIGLKADLPQCGQVAQALADIKIAGVVDRGFGPQSACDKAGLWLTRLNRAFHGQVPLALLDTDVGSQMVQEELYRIRYGIL